MLTKGNKEAGQKQVQMKRFLSKYTECLIGEEGEWVLHIIGANS